MITILLRFLGPMLFIGLQLSMLATARKILLTKNVGDLSPLPSITLIANCVVWSIYGFLQVDYTIFIPNCCGIITGAISAGVFQSFSNRIPLLEYSFCGTFCGIALLLSTLDNNVLNIGLLGCSLSVVMTASPLAVLRTVIRSRSTSSLPFSTCFIMWLSSASWLSYGLLITKDPIIYVPNFLGFSLSSVQMLLFIYYDYGFFKFTSKPIEKNLVV